MSDSGSDAEMEVDEVNQKLQDENYDNEGEEEKLEPEDEEEEEPEPEQEVEQEVRISISCNSGYLQIDCTRSGRSRI